MAEIESNFDIDPHSLLAVKPNEREIAVITHQKLNNVLKEKNVRPVGLDLIREHFVFETLKEIITQTSECDMTERSLLLQRIEKEIHSTVSTWKLLSNQANSYGLKKSNQDKEEIEKLQCEIRELQQKKQELDKMIVDGNTQYDDICEESKVQISELQIKCQEEMQRCQQQNASNIQILQEYKASSVQHKEQ